jgi:uncharacterized protein YndB with AHSA1/START domain
VAEIRIQSFVAAPPERVWDQLLGRADVVLDALPVRAWPGQREEQRPSRLRTTWPGSGGAATELEIDMAPLPGDGGTRVEVRHGGWEGPAAEDALAGHFAGWLQALAALGLLVETGKDPRASSPALAGRERYYASGEMPADTDAVFRALTDAGVRSRWSHGALDGTQLVDSIEGRYARWNVAAPGAEPDEVVIILRPTPRGTHCAVAEYGVVGRSASARWPKMLEHLAAFLR